MFIGDLETLQTASIVAGFPVIFIMFLLAWSFMKASNQDIMESKDYDSPTIHINRREILERIRKRKKSRSALEAMQDKKMDDDSIIHMKKHETDSKIVACFF